MPRRLRRAPRPRTPSGQRGSCRGAERTARGERIAAAVPSGRAARQAARVGGGPASPAAQSRPSPGAGPTRAAGPSAASPGVGHRSAGRDTDAVPGAARWRSAERLPRLARDLRGGGGHPHPRRSTRIRHGAARAQGPAPPVWRRSSPAFPGTTSGSRAVEGTCARGVVGDGYRPGCRRVACRDDALAHPARGHLANFRSRCCYVICPSSISLSTVNGGVFATRRADRRRQDDDHCKARLALEHAIRERRSRAGEHRLLSHRRPRAAHDLRAHFGRNHARAQLRPGARPRARPAQVEAPGPDRHRRHGTEGCPPERATRGAATRGRRARRCS